MSRYRVRSIEGSNGNPRSRREQIVETPSLQDALERFTYWPTQPSPANGARLVSNLGRVVILYNYLKLLKNTNKIVK